jgi:hypothetical protein
MTALAATEPLPQPLAAVGVVTVDVAQRVLYVRLSDLEKGHAQSLFRQSFQAMKTSEEKGSTGGTVWAASPSSDRVAFAKTGDGGLLRFHFPPGEKSFTELVGRPNLTAILTMDRSSCRFLRCKFQHGR